MLYCTICGLHESYIIIRVSLINLASVREYTLDVYRMTSVVTEVSQYEEEFFMSTWNVHVLPYVSLFNCTLV